MQEEFKRLPNYNLHCCVLFKGKKNSRTMLLPLLQTCGCDVDDRTSSTNVRISLFLTPGLRGAARLVRGRLHEAVSLQHMKVYVTDNKVLISGLAIRCSFIIIHDNHSTHPNGHFLFVIVITTRATGFPEYICSSSLSH